MKRKGKGCAWLSKISNSSMGRVVTTQFKGARASSLMARSANTMRGKTLKLVAIEEWTFLGRGGGRTEVVTEISGISLLTEGQSREL